MKALCMALIAVMGLIAGGCGKKGQGGWGEMVVSVVAVPAERQAVEDTIEAIGTLAANEIVDIKSEIDGTVQTIHFEEGQQVKAGDILVELDQSKLHAALAEAQANLTMAEATRGRYAGLIESGAVARQEVDQSEATWASTKALVDRLMAELEDATIKAPFDGTTGARQLSVGQYVARGTSITVLIDADPMKLEFRVPERFLGQIASQQSVKITTAAYPDGAFVGEVYFVDPQVDAATRTVLMKARVGNRDGKLRQGMFAQVDLIVRVNEDAVVIPEMALLHQGEMLFVYTIDAEQKAQMRPVKVGVRLADVVEIAEGLRAGEPVITEGHQKLFPGAKVDPKPPETSGPPGPA